MKKYQQCGVLIVFFVLLSCFVFRAGFGADSVFAASDANIGLMSRVKHALPTAFIGGFRTTPLAGSAIQYSLSARNVLLWLLPVEVFSDVIYPFWIVLSSLVLVTYLRLFKIGWLSCVFGALAAFWTGSITLASAGHVNKPAVAFFFILGLYLIEKLLRAEGVRRRTGYSLLCGGSIGLMLVEQQDVGLYAACFIGPYLLLRLIQVFGRPGLYWIQVLLPLALVSLLLCVGPALKAYEKNISAVDSGESLKSGEKWDFITQWSFPPSEWPDLIAPGYTGWSTGNPSGPYWGEIGQAAEWKTTGKGFQNFRLDSLYIGALPLLLAGFGWVAASRGLKGNGQTAIVMFFWGVAALTAFLLSLGKFSLLYRLFYQLPLVNNVRAPLKFMHNLQMIIGILSAFGLHQLVTFKDNVEKKSMLRWVIGLALAMGGMMLIAAMSPSLVRRFSMWGDYADVIVKLIRQAWVHGAIMALLCGGGVFCMSWKKTTKFTQGVLLVFILAVAFDSVYLTSKYFKSDDLGSMNEGNPVVDFLAAEQANNRVFCLSQEGLYNRWLAVDFPYYGIQAFNVWQMPRMSADNREFLSTVGRNWLRMIELSSVKYVLAPARLWIQIQTAPELASQFDPVLFYRVVPSGSQFQVQAIPEISSLSDQVLLRFKRSIPRMALFSSWEVVSSDQVFRRLVAPDYRPATTLVLNEPPNSEVKKDSGEKTFKTLEALTVTPQEFTGRVFSEQGGIVLCTQSYEPGWTVWVNHRQADLLRCNGIFMGVEVPPGEVTVRFVCPKSRWSFGAQCLGALFALCGLILIPGYRK